MNYATGVFLIEKGSINMDGKPSEVIKKYLEKP